MTTTHIQVGDVSPRIRYAADGDQTAFVYPFPVFHEADLEVYLDEALQTGGYTVAGAGESAGGDVTFDAAPAAGTAVTLRRRIAIQRILDFQQSGSFPAKVINDQLDYLTAAVQQVADDIERRIGQPPSDADATMQLPGAPDRASRLMAFDAQGGVTTVATDTLSLATLQAFTDYRIDSFTGDGAQVAFTLSAEPGQIANTQVFLDGVYQAKANYGLVGDTLTFDTAPPDGVAVEVVHGQAASAYTPDDGSIGDAKIAGVGWSKIGGAPTTLAGYGITDAAPLSHLLDSGNPHSVSAAQLGFVDPILDRANAGDIGATTLTTTGKVSVGADGSGSLGGVSLYAEGASTSAFPMQAKATAADFNGSVYAATADRAATSSYSFFRAWSGGLSDYEFDLKGDGNAYADGTWTGGGADYAELFEWADGNPEGEDRRGLSVVLEGRTVRAALDGEEPIGIVSGRPSVVGDAAWNRWDGKYLKDVFGSYLREDYEVVSWTEVDPETGLATRYSYAADAVPAGLTVPADASRTVQRRRVLNPDFDPALDYTPRSERPEWDCVGLVGKLRLRKGQPVGSRWIRMRDVSADVEEWLVR